MTHPILAGIVFGHDSPLWIPGTLVAQVEKRRVGIVNSYGIEGIIFRCNVPCRQRERWRLWICDKLQIKFLSVNGTIDRGIDNPWQDGV